MMSVIEQTKVTASVPTPRGEIDFRDLARMMSLSNYLVHARNEGVSAPDAISALLNCPKGIAAVCAGRGKRALWIALRKSRRQTTPSASCTVAK